MFQVTLMLEYENMNKCCVAQRLSYIYISKGLQCALTAITIVALWQLPHLGRGMCAYTLFGLHCEVTRVLKLRTVSNA